MSVQIIPVIDLMDGRVVHARGGRRGEYEPIRTPLCTGAGPEDIVGALLALHVFRTIYVADLDAILGRGANGETLTRLRDRFSQIEFWVDAGRSQPDIPAPGLRTVIGTETGVRVADLADWHRCGADFLLSLDFTASGYAGDPDILADPGCWPRDVIVMDLPAVGSARGPDWSRIDPLIARSPDSHWYVAGGIRDERDLEAACTRNVRGVLAATALHTGTLFPSEIRGTKKTPA